VLSAVRLTGALFFDVAARAPWVAEAPAAKLLGPLVLPGSQHVIEYHVVTEGSCWASLIDDSPIPLERGDIVVFPQGDAHVMSSAPGMRGPPELEQYAIANGRSLPITVNLGEGGPSAHVVCGFLGCDATPFNPLLATLPRLIRLRRGLVETELDHVLKLALNESTNARPGSECVLARLSEVLFIEVVRHHVASASSGNTGWLAGLRDEHVGRALAQLHRLPAHDWTLDKLARDVGLSRSMLAERFLQFVGDTPMHYLAKWRMQLAAGLLTRTTSSLAEVATQVGYTSEAAFSRAFKRLVGVAPALYRHGQRVRCNEHVVVGALGTRLEN
jgi:AraC-like DNA-binding protein